MERSLCLTFVYALALCSVSMPCFAAEFGKPMRFSNGNASAMETSLIALLGNPEKWEGRAISVTGFVSPDFHGTLLFPSLESCKLRSLMEQYSVRIDLESMEPEIDWSDLPRKNCQPANVDGYFHEIPREEPKPDEYVIRDRPAYIDAVYIRYY